MKSAALRFIKKNGRVIPIHAATGGIAAATAIALRKHPAPATPLKANQFAKFASTMLAVTGGIAAASSFGRGKKMVIGAHATNEALDAGSTALAFGAYAGRGRAKDRLKAGSKLELQNQALGWTAYAATAARNPEARKALGGYAAKIIAFGRKALRVV